MKARKMVDQDTGDTEYRSGRWVGSKDVTGYSFRRDDKPVEDAATYFSTDMDLDALLALLQRMRDDWRAHKAAKIL